MCEDYPCCGHTADDPCPSRDSKGRERWTCVECGKRLSLKAAASSSICAKCRRRMSRRHYESDLDHDYSMNG